MLIAALHWCKVADTGSDNRYMLWRISTSVVKGLVLDMHDLCNLKNRKQ